ncbi:hypothetical protein V1478_000982 [Vespula squamosa]|uniref:Uncharacterized protein n=1 Tax=Vespula squamosa TaxID=30214 RepID=A0ABD2C711_VESSQ
MPLVLIRSAEGKLRKIQKNVLNTFDGDSRLAVAAKPVEAKQKHGRKAETVISHRDVLQVTHRELHEVTKVATSAYSTYLEGICYKT